MKLIFFRITGIRYDGDSIGNDIAIDVQAGGASISLNKKLSAGSNTSLEKLIAEFTAQDNPLIIPVSATIIERDPVYNDVGQSSSSYSVVLDGATLQSFQLTVQVKEDGALSKAGTAVFTLDFAAEITEAIRYLPPTDDGFLVVLDEPGRKRISLPSALEVRVERISGGREYFVVMEGRMKGMHGSVSLGDDKRSRLLGANPHTSAVRLDYSLSKSQLSTQDSASVYSAISERNPIEPGTYDLEIPDAPHRGGLHYPGAPHARTWFRIGHQGDRYLHTGSASAGCVTVLDTARWEELYDALIVGRKGDGISVGVLRVFD